MSTITPKIKDAIKGIVAAGIDSERSILHDALGEVEEEIKRLSKRVRKIRDRYDCYFAAMLEDEVLKDEFDSMTSNFIRLFEGESPEEIWACADIEVVKKWIQEWRVEKTS